MLKSLPEFILTWNNITNIYQSIVLNHAIMVLLRTNILAVPLLQHVHSVLISLIEMNWEQLTTTRLPYVERIYEYII